MIDREEAAHMRALKARGTGDRPGQRRAQRDAPAGLWTPAVRARIEVRAAANSDVPAFEGFASVTGQSYEMYDFFGPYDELVAVGAFAETLADDQLDVPLVIDHTSSRRIARTRNPVSPLILSEVTEGETTGLLAQAPTLQLSDLDTAYIVPKLQSGLIDEMSFRFMITEGRWSEDFMTFTIRSVDIDRGDVSIVGYGANPHTQGAGVRSKTKPDERARALLELSRAGDVRTLRA